MKPGFDSWFGKICSRRDRLPAPVFLGFLCGSSGKESACNEGDLGSIPGLGRSPGEGKGYPLQYSGLENSMNSSWGRKMLDMTERLSFTHWYKTFACFKCQILLLWKKINLFVPSGYFLSSPSNESNKAKVLTPLTLLPQQSMPVWVCLSTLVQVMGSVGTYLLGMQLQYLGLRLMMR